jgi:hypothetical protein
MASGSLIMASPQVGQRGQHVVAGLLAQCRPTSKIRVKSGIIHFDTSATVAA